MSDDIWQQPPPRGGDPEETADQPDASPGEPEHPGGTATITPLDSSDPWASYEPLYNEHHDRLYRVAVLLCSGNVADAEDAVAETFIRVHRAWLDGRVDDFFSYARQSLVNHVMSRYRKQETARKYLTVTSHEEQQRGRPHDDQIVDSAVVFEALDKLSPRRRTAVVLRFFEDLPYHEIAEAMDVALGTAKAQVSKGLEQLRGLMAEASGE